MTSLAYEYDCVGYTYLRLDIQLKCLLLQGLKFKKKMFCLNNSSC